MSGWQAPILISSTTGNGSVTVSWTFSYDADAIASGKTGFQTPDYFVVTTALAGTPPSGGTYIPFIQSTLNPFNNTGIYPYEGVDVGENYTQVPMNGMVGDTFTYTFSNLANGTSYDCYIVSRNRGALYNSNGSLVYYLYNFSKSLIVTAMPVGPPTAILNLSLIPGNSQIQIMWNLPSNNGGSPITSYSLQYNTTGSGSSEPWYSLTNVSPTTLTYMSYAYTGLSNGTTYYIRVAAVNNFGTSVYTGYSARPVGPPADITLTFVSGNGQITLNWGAPPNNGGATVSYILESNTTGYSGPWSSLAYLPASTLSYTYTGLTNGTTYFLRIAATNVYGTSAFLTIASTPSTIPNQLASLSPTAGDAKLRLQWSAPYNGGAVISSYTLQYSTESSTGPWTSTTLPASPLEYVMTGLTNGTTYYLQFAATNVRGTGLYTSTTGIPVGPPSAVSSLSATAGNSQITLRWVAPSNNGGAAITGYKLQYSTSADGPWRPLITLQASALATLEYTIPGLTNGIRYYLQVEPTNTYGTRVASTVVSAMPLTNPSIPQNFTGIGINGGVYLSWTAPSIIGALSLSYNLQYSTAPSVSWSQSYSYASSILTLPFTGLTNGTLYYFRLSAENNEGLSSDYAVISAMPQIACQGTTIYKPNNVRFAKQGGVSSSTRTLSLRVNTVNLNGNSFYSAFGAEGANAGKYSTEYNPGYFLKNKYQPPNYKMCCTLTPSPAPTI